jgi:hypothetical protein
MSDAEQRDDDSENAGCVFLLGVAITGIALGSIFSAAVGWLIVGIGLLVIAFADASSRAKRKRK